MKGRLDYPVETKVLKITGALMDKNEVNAQEQAPRTYREAIDRFLKERLDKKLETLTSPEKEDDRQKAIDSFKRPTWLEDAARRVKQLKVVTHSLKPIHPDAKGTTLNVNPDDLPSLDEVGSHVLRTGYELDVVGNAAALDVYKLLELEVDGKSLLAALEFNEESALYALDDDPVKAKSIQERFLSILSSDGISYESHTLAKQVYWLKTDDPLQDSDYCLIAPLYPAALVHSMCEQIGEDRFGDVALSAQKARKSKCWHDGEVRVYKGLAKQKMGGTKPQNISLLNSKRIGLSYLLSCAPPEWSSRGMSLPMRQKTVFGSYFGRRPGVRLVVRKLREFLKSDPPSNMQTELQRDRYLERLIDEVLVMAAELQQESIAGWSSDDERFGQLAEAEKLWLDPFRAELPEQEGFALARLTYAWPVEIGGRFGNWLNGQLRESLPVGDIESKEWARLLLSDDEFRRHLRVSGGDIKEARGRTDLATISVGEEVS